MTFLQMKYFAKVCECGSVTKAARVLHVSQPSISYAIKELEEEYQITLFSRSGNQMIPTRRGELLWKSSDEILRQWDELEIQMEKYCRNEMRMGISPVIRELFGRQIMQEFQQVHPEIHIAVIETNSVEAVEKVKTGELDAALIFWTEKAEDGMRIDIVGTLKGNAVQEKISLPIGLVSKRKASHKINTFLEYARNR